MDVYHSHSEGVIIQVVDTDGSPTFKNQGNIEANGAELEFSGRWQDGKQGRLSYTFQEGKDKQTGFMLVNSPRHLIKLNQILPLISEKLFFGLDVQFVSKRKTVLANTAPSFTIANATLYSLNFKAWELSAHIYNLFDKQYGDVASTEHKQAVITQDGRSYRLKATYHF